MKAFSYVSHICKVIIYLKEKRLAKIKSTVFPALSCSLFIIEMPILPIRMLEYRSLKEHCQVKGGFNLTLHSLHGNQVPRNNAIRGSPRFYWKPSWPRFLCGRSYGASGETANCCLVNQYQWLQFPGIPVILSREERGISHVRNLI